MTKLSVNINKIATLRTARGGNMPDVVQAARDCERFGAQGITVHPRPDERHIRYADVRELKPVLCTEFNIEGFPCKEFCELVCEVIPTQVTLVPDLPGQLTSDHGWDTVQQRAFLTDVVQMFHEKGIRTSLFISPDVRMVEGAKETAARLGLDADRADFRCQDAGAAAAQLATEGAQPDVIVVDPPRKGCDEATLTAIAQMAPRTIVMVSCNAATAARDTKWLTEHGYKAVEVQPVDLFPRTKHVECVVKMVHA